MAARAEPLARRPPLAAGRASPGLPPRGGVRLRALVLIRWAAVAGQLFTAATVHWGLGFTLPLAAGRRRDRPVGAAQSCRQPRPAGVGAHRRSRGHDLPRLRHRAACRAALSHRRADNPFALLLLAPVAIGATILSLASNIALSLLTIVSIGLLALFHQPLPWNGTPPELPEIYQAGVWAGLTPHRRC